MHRLLCSHQDPSPSHHRGRFARSLPLAALLCLLSSCALLGFSPKGPTHIPITGRDNIEDYRRSLATSPSGPEADEYRTRLAHLELIEARTHLRPVFEPDTAFFEEPGAATGSPLWPHVKMIFDSQESGFFRMRATAIELDLSQDTLHLFAQDDAPLELPVQRETQPAFIVVDEPAVIPLIQASSFEARIDQLAQYGGGLHFCFFSASKTTCEDGYEFFYDGANLHHYALTRHSGAASSPLCEYRMNTSNHQEGDSLSLDPATGQRRNPSIEIAAHNGYIAVRYSGQPICQVKEPAFQSGYFLLSGAPGLRRLSIEFNDGSHPFYVEASALVDLEASTQPLEQKDGGHYEAHNAFVRDFNAFLKARSGEPIAAEFTNAYFLQFFGKAEADEAFAAIEDSGDIDAFLAFLAEHPVSSHSKQAEQRIYELAREANTPEAYRKYLAQYPSTDRYLDVRRHLADAQWSDIVDQPTPRKLRRYLKTFPDGYHHARAQLLLDGLAYRQAHQAEVDAAERLREQATAITDKAPQTLEWDVAIVDYVDGTLYFNLNSGPTLSGSATHTQAITMAQAQMQAHETTCELLRRRLPEVENCLHPWNNERGNIERSIPLSVAIRDAIERLYLPALRKQTELDRMHLLELLARLEAIEPDEAYGETAEDALLLATTYENLGLRPQAVYAFYRYARTDKPTNVTWAGRQLAKTAAPLLEDPDMKWILERYGKK